MSPFPLRCMPVEERPRERLISAGADALSIPELLAIILGSGTRGKSVLELGEEIFMRFGSLQNLLDATLAELMEIKGMGRAKAIQLKAVFGIALKYGRPTHLEQCPIQSSEHAFALVKQQIAYNKQETMLVVLRNVRGVMIHREPVSLGTLSEVLVHPREVFYPAVRHKAYSMIIAHNHPSGDPTPSAADLDLTRALLLAGRTMGIGIDDHLIVCPDSFVSLQEKGYIPSRERY